MNPKWASIIGMFIINFLGAGQAYALSTTIELNNNKLTSVPLISAGSTGTLTPAAPNPVAASSSQIIVSDSASPLVDAGALNYLDCRFNWSVLDMGGYYSFSIGATPAGNCVGTVLIQDVYTGEYSIRFDIYP